MLERAVGVLASVTESVVVVEHPLRPIDRAWLGARPARVVQDPRDGGPLAGLEAGLSAVASEWALVLAADMPWLRPELLELLAAAATAADGSVDVVALESAPGVAEPLPAVYRRRVLARARRNLDVGRLRMLELLADTSVQLVERRRWLAADPSGRSLRSVNRPEDLPAP